MVNVSIVVPIFNVENFIEKCAKSLFEQTYQNIEYIFVDDCSPDNSVNILKKILEEYPIRRKQTKIITHEITKGSSTARNSGLRVATGKYIFYCDSDDWVEKNAIEEMYNTIVKENADILWCDFYFSHLNKDVLSKQNFVEYNERCVKALMTEKIHGSIWNKMYKKSLFVENNITFPDYDMCEDLITNIKLFHFAKKISYLPKSFYHYVIYNCNSMSTINNEKKLNDIINNVNNLIYYFKQKQIKVYDVEFNILKLISKHSLLLSINKNDFRKWKNIYPEANKYIMKFTAKPLHIRLLGFIISNNLWVLTDLWIFLKKTKHYFK